MNDIFNKTVELIKDLEKEVLKKAELAIQDERVFNVFRKQILDLFGHSFALSKLKEIFQKERKGENSE